MLPDQISEYENHKLIYPVVDKRVGLNGAIFIHREHPPYPSFGATRLWRYESEGEMWRDGLRLSKMMSYKSAIAKLPYGGAKGVLLWSPEVAENKKEVLRTYASKVTELDGRFITGTDVGLEDKDILNMKRTCDFVVGVNAKPAQATAIGLFQSIHICIEEVFGCDDLSKRSFAIQGVGKVGEELISLLYAEGATVFASDLDEEKVNLLCSKYPKVTPIRNSDIKKMRVDVYSPCALGCAIEPNDVEELKCKIIAGGANNQLAHDSISNELFRRNILYAPDYLVNAGGLISVVDEYENHTYQHERAIKRVKKIISETLHFILETSKQQNCAPLQIANRLAENILNQYT